MDIKEFDLIYAMGCSWVQGCELNGDILELKPYERIENRFTEVLQEWTNIEFVNDAVGAGGNDKIVRRTFEFVKSNPNKKILVEKYCKLIISDIHQIDVLETSIHNEDLFEEDKSVSIVIP